MKGIEVVMVKWLLLVGVLLGIGVSCARAETTSVEELERAYGNYEASCQNLMLVKSESAEVDFTGKVKVLPIDVERCGRILKPLQMNDVFRPLFVMASKVDETPFSKQRVLRKIQQLVEAWRQKNMVKSLHVNAQPLANACASVAAGQEKEANAMCYFGGPIVDSGKPFKAIYQAMLDHALPDLETVCSPEPITSKTASTMTFSEFLTDKEMSLAWEELQTSLKSDGFQCDQDHCQRNILGIVVPKAKMLDNTSDANGKPAFGIIPRYLEIYRGEWHRIGPGYSCMLEQKDKEGGDCSRAKNGVQKGICLASEDWHIWFRVVDAMNESKSQ